MRHTRVTQAPWDSRGHLMPFGPKVFERADWRPNEPFQATATFMGYVRDGIVRFLLHDTDGRCIGEATMTPKYFEEVVLCPEWNRRGEGEIAESWLVGRVGPRYTLMLADDPVTREQQQGAPR